MPQDTQDEVGSLTREVARSCVELGQGRIVWESTAEPYRSELGWIGRMKEEYRAATRDRLAQTGTALGPLRVQEGFA